MPVKLEFRNAWDALYNLRLTLERKVPAEIEKSVNYALSDISRDLASHIQAKLRLKGPHKGGMASYRRYKPYWTPAFPGEPPARISSRLLNSITVNESGAFPGSPGAIGRATSSNTQFSNNTSFSMGKYRSTSSSQTFSSGAGAPHTFKQGYQGIYAKRYVVGFNANLPLVVQQYAGWQEHGTSRFPARPFMMPAFQEFYANSGWLEHVQRALEGAVKNTTGFNVRTNVSKSALDMRVTENRGTQRSAAVKRINKGKQKYGPLERHHKKEINRLTKEAISPKEIAKRLDVYQAMWNLPSTHLAERSNFGQPTIPSHLMKYFGERD